MKKIISILLIIGILSTLSCCGKSEDSSVKKSNSKKDESYSSLRDEWKKEKNNTTQFSNQECLSAPTPGSENLKNVDINAEKNKTYEKRNYPVSKLQDKNNLKYYYEGKNYIFGITNSNEEVIAYKSEGGELLDAINGAGKYVLMSPTGGQLVSEGQIKEFTKSLKDGYDALTVDYVSNGTFSSKTTFQTVYIFKENCINISAEVNSTTDSTISASKTKFIRSYYNKAQSSENKINSQWVYPDNGDYPYQEFESLCIKDKLTDSLNMYSFIRGEDINTSYILNQVSSTNLPMSFNDSKGLYYFYKYDISFVDTKEEYYQGSDYLGLFKSKSSDFAAGIAPITHSNDNSTVFIGKNIDFNFNVTNLTEKDLKFSLRYDIRDYYSNIVDSGIFVDSTVYQYTGANRKISLNLDKYGIYYINLYVISENSKYMECYPFALLEDYNYKCNSTSPFGINSAWRENDLQVINTAKLYSKIGVATTRINKNDILLAKELRKYSITQLNGIIGETNETANNVNAYVSNVMNTLDSLSEYIDSFEVGNEMNLQTISGKISPEEVYPKFYKYTYKPTYDVITSKYPNIKYIPTPFSACQQEWADQIANGFSEDLNNDGIAETHTNGIWNDLKIISTHIYGTPWMPDQYALYTPEYAKGVWSIEGALQRMEDTLKKYSKNPTDIDFYITEVGYATSAEDKAKICLRTQADYNIRSAILCEAYGADRIQFYNFYDRNSYYSGFNNGDDEWNFGMFYETDFYGLVKPKPSGIAFANMTRQLESVNKNSSSIYQKYDKGWDKPSVRAFKLKTQMKGDVVVAWSNKEVLTNGKKNNMGLTNERTANLPWNNQWTKTDDTEFETNNSTVTVVDIMGNKTEYKAKNNKVTIKLTGSPVYIYGIK